MPKNVGRRAIHTRRYAKQVPGHYVQVDVKFLTLKTEQGKKTRRYQYTAIDDATRIRALKIYNRHNQKNEMDDVDLNKKLIEWEKFYNFSRPHTAFCGKTPYEALRNMF